MCIHLSFRCTHAYIEQKNSINNISNPSVGQRIPVPALLRKCHKKTDYCIHTPTHMPRRWQWIGLHTSCSNGYPKCNPLPSGTGKQRFLLSKTVFYSTTRSDCNVCLRKKTPLRLSTITKRNMDAHRLGERTVTNCLAIRSSFSSNFCPALPFQRPPASPSP